MKRTLMLAVALMTMFCVLPARTQTVRHVWTNSPDPNPPYDSWDNAARDMQTAIDAADASAGDWVWVTNGVYDTGGVPVSGLANRVHINKAIRVESVNGPSNTVIVGRWHNPEGYPDPTNYFGPNAVRCVNINAAGASLLGFTLTNGSTLDTGTTERRGGGLYIRAQAAIYNCVLTANRSHHSGGGAYVDAEIAGEFYNCIFSDNQTGNQGGAVQGVNSVFHGCEFHGNSAGWGGAAQGGNFFHCVFVGNTASNEGGAGNLGRYYGCVFDSNSARIAGGAVFRPHALYNCLVVNNSKHHHSGMGGGVAMSETTEIYNSLFAGNYSESFGGGVQGAGTTYNCTIVGNSAVRNYGGGVSGGTHWNAIVYGNDAPASYNHTDDSVFHYSMSSPLPEGDFNITGNPMFVYPGSGYGTNHIAGNYRLQRVSLAKNKGLNFGWMSDPDILTTNEWLGRDLDGNPRIRLGTVDMGAYEYIPAGSVFMIRGAP